jgi:acyl-CoA thioesterase-2
VPADSPPADLRTGGVTDHYAWLGLTPDGEHGLRAAPRGGAPGRVFGGAVAAQALLAAGRTVPRDRAVHSAHAYFVRPALTTETTTFRTDTVRDGGSYTTRRVAAEQGSDVVLELLASFSLPEEGFRHQEPALDAPGPEDLPGPGDVAADTDGPVRDWFAHLPARHPFELRFAEPLPRLATARGEPAPLRQRFWFRCRAPLPDAPLLHACALTYASDMLLLSASLGPHQTTVGAPDLLSASLDHTVWFHTPARVDDWLFYDQSSSWAGGGRTLCHGRVFARSGRLVATVAQEGMIRQRNPRTGARSARCGS